MVALIKLQELSFVVADGTLTTDIFREVRLGNELSCMFWPSPNEIFHGSNAIAAVARPDGTVLVAVTHRLGRTDAFLEKLRRRGWTASPRPRRRDAPQNTDVYEVKY